jgi:hypothetical protein
VLPGYGSAETRRGYAKNLRQLRPVFGAACWAEVTLPALKDYLRNRTAKVQANRELSLLSIVWNWARGEGPDGSRVAGPRHGEGALEEREGAREVEATPEVLAAWDAIYAEGDIVLRDCMDLSERHRHAPDRLPRGRPADQRRAAPGGQQDREEGRLRPGALRGAAEPGRAPPRREGRAT